MPHKATFAVGGYLMLLPLMLNGPRCQIHLIEAALMIRRRKYGKLPLNLDLSELKFAGNREIEFKTGIFGHKKLQNWHSSLRNVVLAYIGLVLTARSLSTQPSVAARS